MGLLALAMCSCGDPPKPNADGGPAVDGATEPTAQLIVESDATLALVFREPASLVFRYLESDGTPVVGEQVYLALVGAANDASLETVARMTDRTGRVRTQVRAGTVPSAFRVRATADRATPVAIDVSVSEAGFGNVRARYTLPPNRQTDRIEALLYTDAFCDDEELGERTAARVRSLDPSENETTFATLPADVGYAVVGRSLGPTVSGTPGATLGWGCTDSVTLQADVATFVPVTIEPLPLDADGDFDVGLVLGGEVLSSSVKDLLESTRQSTGQGTLLLDAVDAVLRRQGDTAAAAALAAARSNENLDDDLDTDLNAAGAGPSVVLGSLETSITERVESMNVDLRLTIGTPSGVVRTGAGVTAADGVTGRLDLNVGANATGQALLLAKDTDALQVESLSFPMPLGALGLATLEALAGDAGAASFAEMVRSELGCEVLGAVISSLPAVATACGSACVAEACDDAASSFEQTVSSTVRALDLQRNELRLQGSAVLVDSDGDRRVSRLDDGEIGGEWLAPDESDSDLMVGTFEGSRALE